MSVTVESKNLAGFYVFKSFSINPYSSGQVSILEYPISGSGMEQGMNYIIP